MPSTATDRLQGLTTSVAVKPPCVAVTTTSVTLSGEQTVGGIACVTGDRVLVAITGGSVNNGIWVVDTGAWSRAKDFDGSRDAVTGTLIMVNGVSAGNLDFWSVTTEGSIVPGTTVLVIEQADAPSVSNFIDPADYGADPAHSGAVNTAAIVEALSACAAGYTLTFGKPGSYTVVASVVDAAIVLPEGVNLLMAPGAWLTATTSFGTFIAPKGRNNIVCNIDGDGYPASGGVTGTWGIENVGVRAYFSSDVGLGANDVVIHDSEIKNVSYPIFSHGGEGWRVYANKLHRYKQTGVLMGYYSGYPCKNNMIFGNYFDDAGDYAVAFYQVGGEAAGVGSYNEVSNNVAHNMNQRTNGYAFGVEQGVAANQHHFSFIGNVYETDGSVAVTTGGITISTCTDSLVSGNIISCPSYTVAKGINCVSSVSCEISGNVIDGFSETAIDTDGSTGVNVRGNTIHNCGGASPTYPAVRLAATLDTQGITFSGNTLKIDAGFTEFSSTTAAVRCLSAASKTVKDITAQGNTIINPNDRAFSCEGTAGIPQANINIIGNVIVGTLDATFFQREPVYMDYCNRVSVSGNVVSEALRGFVLNNVVGGTVGENDFKGATNTIATLFDITGSSNLKIRNNEASAAVTTSLTPSARLSSATYGTTATGNTKLVTEAQGKTTAIATGATVTHGLFTTPTSVQLTAATSGASDVHVSASGTATFTVTFSGGGSEEFYWQAQIR